MPKARAAIRDLPQSVSVFANKNGRGEQYHLAKTRHAGLTSESMGHRDTNMLYRHYRDVIKE